MVASVGRRSKQAAPQMNGGFFMLKGISPIISPELLKIIAEMGHGDELVLADANFPGTSIGQKCVRCDGHGCAEVMQALLTLSGKGENISDQHVRYVIGLVRSGQATKRRSGRRSARRRIPTCPPPNSI